MDQMVANIEDYNEFVVLISFNLTGYCFKLNKYEYLALVRAIMEKESLVGA